jgi:ribose-phosphate pyrophosphokinase
MIEVIGVHLKKQRFPNNELHLVVDDIKTKNCTVVFKYEDDAEIFELMLICDVLKSQGCSLEKLFMSYVPYSQQDRRMTSEEPLSVKVFCNIINQLDFKQVNINDAHSPVTTALLDNCIESKQHESRTLKDLMVSLDEFYLISPDAGAQKKLDRVARESTSTPLGIIECTKVRDVKTGQILNTEVYCNGLGHKPCLIVDDICHGGKTFIEIAKKLKERDCGKIILYVTHGFFSKGFAVFDGIIDQIYTLKGEVYVSPN